MSVRSNLKNVSFPAFGGLWGAPSMAVLRSDGELQRLEVLPGVYVVPRAPVGRCATQGLRDRPPPNPSALTF
jgi:hypothetical protein